MGPSDQPTGGGAPLRRPAARRGEYARPPQRPAVRQPAVLPLWFLFANFTLVGSAFVLGFMLAPRSPYPFPQGPALKEIYEAIQEDYVEPTDGGTLLDAAIGAMADLDAYSQYVPPNEVSRFVEATTGTYEGIGVVSEYSDDGRRLFVRFPFAGGPGEAAGLRPGDEIVAVDGERLAQMNEAERKSLLAERVRGPTGSRVALTIARTDEELVLEVERAPVSRPAVKWAQHLEPDQGLGYVYVADFHHGVTERLTAAIEGLRSAPAGLRGLILDLRFDGGGSLDECVAMTRLFQRSGRIVTVRRRSSEEVYEADPAACRYPELPLVLLVNGATASASEVLAGALQDHGRAAVVGTRTFGKGVVQTIYTWEGLEVRLKLTTAHYYTPSGRNLGARRPAGHPRAPMGLEPDHPVAVDEELLGALHAALLAFEVPERYRDAVAAFVAPRGGALPGIVPAAEDPQLAAALEVLRARVAQAREGQVGDQPDGGKPGGGKPGGGEGR